jgi:peroxiredoxin
VTPAVGSRAPDFTLPDQDRQPVSLSERGGCAKECAALGDEMATLKSLSASVIGVTVDTFFALKAWADAQRIAFPLLSDFNKTVIRDYGVFNEDMIGLKGIAKRAVFVIDRQGTIRHREVLDDARNEPDYAKIVETLKALQ